MVERNFGLIDLARRGRQVAVVFTTIGPGSRVLSAHRFEWRCK